MGENMRKSKPFFVFVAILVVVCLIFINKDLSSESNSSEETTESTNTENDSPNEELTENKEEKEIVDSKEDVEAEKTAMDKTTTTSKDEEKAVSEKKNSQGTEKNLNEDSVNYPENVIYNEKSGHTYAVYDYTDYGLKKDFDVWEQFCEKQGGYLAVINDAEENEFIYQYLRNEGLTLAFFGYTDQNSEGKWTWVNGRNSTYTNWAPGQPNNGANNKKPGGENYAQFYKDTANGMWNDSKIGVNSYKFVCEWDE